MEELFTISCKSYKKHVLFTLVIHARDGKTLDLSLP